MELEAPMPIKQKRKVTEAQMANLKLAQQRNKELYEERKQMTESKRAEMKTSKKIDKLKKKLESLEPSVQVEIVESPPPEPETPKSNSKELSKPRVIQERHIPIPKESREKIMFC